MNTLIIKDESGQEYYYPLITSIIQNGNATCAFAEIKNVIESDFLKEWIKNNSEENRWGKIVKDDIIYEFKNPLRISSVTGDDFKIITFKYASTN